MSQARRIFLTATAVAALGLSSAAMAWSFHWGKGEEVRGDGQIKRETRKLGDFESISLAGPFEIKVRQSANQRIELEADANLLAYVETEVGQGRNGKTLKVQVKRGYSLYSKQPLRIEVDMASLRALALAGSGKAEVESMKSEKLDFSIAGNGSVSAPQLEVGSIKLSVAGNGDIVLGGKATEFGLSIAGSGDVKAGALNAEEVKVSISGSGDAEVQAQKKLKVSIAGSGDVVYSGNPELSTSIAGSGSVKRQ